MKGTHIGELEELVLLAVGSIYENAYALRILEVITENTSRNLDVTAIHAVLRRLDDKGFVKSSMGGATASRGGRRKRFFTLTQAGRQAVDDAMQIRLTLYNKLPRLTFSGSGL